MDGKGKRRTADHPRRCAAWHGPVLGGPENAAPSSAERDRERRPSNRSETRGEDQNHFSENRDRSPPRVASDLHRRVAPLSGFFLRAAYARRGLAGNAEQVRNLVASLRESRRRRLCYW